MINLNNNSINTDKKYSVLFKNESEKFGKVCIYQLYPNSVYTNVKTLVWLSRPSHPLTHVNFSWTPNYNFIWMENEELRDGAVLSSSQIIDIDLTSQNQIELGYEYSAYKFDNLRRGKDGVLTVVQNSTIPLKEAFVGIGMAGYPTCLVQTQPNRSNVFIPYPSYWIAFGEYEQGTVLKLGEIAPVELKFGNSIHSLVVTLNKDNTWSIEQKQD